MSCPNCGRLLEFVWGDGGGVRNAKKTSQQAYNWWSSKELKLTSCMKLLGVTWFSVHGTTNRVVVSSDQNVQSSCVTFVVSGPVWQRFVYRARKTYCRRMLSPVPQSAAIGSTCRTTIVPAVLYGCETWCLTFREEHRLWVYGNGVLRKIFGTKREEVTGVWRILHNEELCDIFLSKYYSGKQIKKNVMAGACSTFWDRRDAQVVLVGKLRPLGRPRHRWDDIKMNLQEVGCGSME